VHGVDTAGEVVIRRQLKRRYVLAFFQKLPSCVLLRKKQTSSLSQSLRRSFRRIILTATATVTTQKFRRNSWWKQLWVWVLIGMALGVAMGMAVPHLAAQMGPLGDAFIKLIRMLIAPIIFCTVVAGIAHMADMARIGRVAIKAIIYFEVMTTIALIIGLLAVNIMQPGAGMNVDVSKLNHLFGYLLGTGDPAQAEGYMARRLNWQKRAFDFKPKRALKDEEEFRKTDWAARFIERAEESRWARRYKRRKTAAEAQRLDQKDRCTTAPRVDARHLVSMHEPFLSLRIECKTAPEGAILMRKKLMARLLFADVSTCIHRGIAHSVGS
jgi:Sodium:dicarboxylate symporter family